MLIAFSSRQGFLPPRSPANSQGSCGQGCRCSSRTVRRRPGAEGKGSVVQGKARRAGPRSVPTAIWIASGPPRTLPFVPALAELCSPTTNLISDPLSSFQTPFSSDILLVLHQDIWSKHRVFYYIKSLLSTRYRLFSIWQAPVVW